VRDAHTDLQAVHGDVGFAADASDVHAMHGWQPPQRLHGDGGLGEAAIDCRISVYRCLICLGDLARWCIYLSVCLSKLDETCFHLRSRSVLPPENKASRSVGDSAWFDRPPIDRPWHGRRLSLGEPTSDAGRALRGCGDTGGRCLIKSLMACCSARRYQANVATEQPQKDWSAAEQYYRRAVQVFPEGATPCLSAWLAVFLSVCALHFAAPCAPPLPVCPSVCLSVCSVCSAPACPRIRQSKGLWEFCCVNMPGAVVPPRLQTGGNSFNQLAVLATYEGKPLPAVYYYFRSLAVAVPFLIARENLLLLFEQNRAR
jgi:Est1 DNA/RNA binding domain